MSYKIEGAKTVWVACSIREFGPVGNERHLVSVHPKTGVYALNTLCGHSAAVVGIWRKNTSKPMCSECQTLVLR